MSTLQRWTSVEECCRFFDDLCAVTELRAMEQRFDVAKMLHAGKRVYTTILQETGASSATARVRVASDA